MRRLLTTFLTLTLVMTVAACNPAQPLLVQVPENPGKGNGEDSGEPGENDKMRLTVKVGSILFRATLDDSQTAKAFKDMLPMTVSMNEHAGNEKYHNLPKALPTAASSPGTIRTGDIMLYGSRTLVVFYKSFRTSYSYTRIGRVEDTSGLEVALGRGSVVVTFEQFPE